MIIWKMNISNIDISNGSKSFIAYTMDLTKIILKLMAITEVNTYYFLKLLIKHHD